MTLTVVFTTAARADVLEAEDWYERQRVNLGQEFINELDRLIGRIVSRPLQFPISYRDVRRAALRRFPYGIFYRILPDVIQVVACLHVSCDPRISLSRA